MTEEQKNAIAEIRTRNPADTIEALSREDGISIAQQIVLVRMESPLLLGDVSDPVANAMAVYAMSLPVGEAARLAQNRTVLEAVALEWVDGVSRKDFAEMLDALLSAILLFWKLLPRPEGDGEKKKASAMATATSPSSSNGPAAPTDGPTDTRRGRFRRFMSRFSTAATRSRRAE